MKIKYVKKGVTATGALETQAAPGDELFSKFAIQVKGEGGAPTSWTVVVEGCLAPDLGVWTTIATHNATDGSTVMQVDKPVTHFRANVTAVTLGPATGLTVVVAAGGAP